MSIKAVVTFSGGLDSTVCLAWAKKQFGGADQIAAISFDYQQRHKNELIVAQKICSDWGILHKILPLPFLKELTTNALTSPEVDLQGKREDGEMNVAVTGRNGFFLHMSALYAHSLKANHIIIGVNEVDSPDFPDCRPEYIRSAESYLRFDFGKKFSLSTPLIDKQKEEIWEMGHHLGIVETLLHDTVTCYQGIIGMGCGHCPSCHLRQKGLSLFLQKYPQYRSQS